MGKFSTYAKRGSAAQMGFLPPPVATDWTFTSPVASQVRFSFSGAIPPQAAGWIGRIRTASGAWTNTALQVGATLNTGAASGTLYFAQIAWGNAAGSAVSEWSDTKSVTAT